MGNPLLNRHIVKLDADLVHLCQINPGPLHEKPGIEEAGRDGNAADDLASRGGMILTRASTPIWEPTLIP